MVSPQTNTNIFPTQSLKESRENIRGLRTVTAEIPSTVFQYIEAQFDLETDLFHNFCKISVTRTI